MHQKFFYNYHNLFSQRIKTSDLLANTWANIVIQNPHFSGDFNKVEGIRDCADQLIQRSSNIKAQYQTYSTYKSHNTIKKLVICAKSGSVSYVSVGLRLRPIFQKGGDWQDLNF